jgi:hypothetical protein
VCAVFHCRNVLKSRSFGKRVDVGKLIKLMKDASYMLKSSCVSCVSLQMAVKTRNVITTPSVRATAVAPPSVCAQKLVSM